MVRIERFDNESRSMLQLNLTKKLVIGLVVTLLIGTCSYKSWIDSKTGWPIQIGGQGGVWSASISPNRQEVATSIGETQFWSLPERKQRLAFDTRYVTNVIAWSPDSKRIVKQDGKVLGVWEADDATSFAALLPNRKPYLWDLAWSYDQNYIAASYMDKVVQFWRIGEERGRYIGQTLPISATYLAFSPVENVLVLDGDKGIVLWDIEQNRELYRLETKNTKHLIFSDDGTLIAGAGYESVDVWNIQEKRLIQTFPSPKGSANTLDFSPDNRLLLIAGGDLGSVAEPAPLQVWRIADGQLIQHFDGHQGGIIEAGFLADGTTIISLDRGTMRIWQLSEDE